MFISFNRIIKSGWKSFSRDSGLITANLFIMVMTISLITSLFLFKDINEALINTIEEKVDISVYFKEEVSENDILKIHNEIIDIPEVKEVEYISREDAFMEFTDRHRDDIVLLESLEEIGMNPFLASLNVKAFEASQYGAVVSFLESSSFGGLIEKVDYYQRKPVIDRMFDISSGINTVGIVFSIILAIVAILVAFNSVRLSIYNAREEIKVQRLVGASNWFIRGPFLVQGVIIGLLATVISFILFGLVCLIFNSGVQFLFPELNLISFFIDNFWIVLFIQLFTGIGLSMVSSSIAIRRYLRV